MMRLGQALAMNEWAHRHVASPLLRPALGGRVSGVVDSIQDWAEKTAGASYESIHPSHEIERKPPKTLHDDVHQAFLRKHRHMHPEVFRAVIPNGRIAGLNPVVLTEDRSVFMQSTFGGWQIEHNPVLRRRLHRASRLRGRYGVLVGPWYFNYYHWMLELLPRAKVFEDPDLGDLPVIVPAHLAPPQFDSLELAGIPRDRVVTFDHSHVVVDELVFPSLIGTSGSPPRWAAQWLRDRLAPAVPSRGRKIFISRARATGPVRRRIVNEEEVMALLDPLGFDRLQPELHSLEDQLRFFAEAQIVVAPHGSGLVNMIAARDATLIELHAEDKVRLTYHALADLLDFDYWYLLCESRSHEDLVVDIEQLEQTLHAALASQA